MRIAISIIIPVYRVAPYLRECLNSVLHQTFSSWECILVDDGSPDNSIDICNEFAQQDVRFRVYRKNNGGVSTARNMGLKEAKGEWVTFIDGDDFISETYLQCLYQPIKDGYKVDFVHGGCTNYERGSITSIEQEYDYCVGDDKGKVFSLFRGLVVSKLFKTEILTNKNLLFDEGMKIAEDMAFTIDYLFYVEKYAFVPERGYYYRRDNVASATHNQKWTTYQQSYYDFNHLYNSTRGYMKTFDISEEDSCIRMEQRAKQFAIMLRTMYHDESFSRHKRIQELMDYHNNDYYGLLRYLGSSKISNRGSQLLLRGDYKKFDCQQSLIEKIEKFKSIIKALLK